jgi:hypothetical protein
MHPCSPQLFDDSLLAGLLLTLCLIRHESGVIVRTLPLADGARN